MKFDHMPANSGVYLIHCTSGRDYVGSSCDMNYRMKQHIFDLNCNNHINRVMQRSWNKYGPDAFTCYVLQITDELMPSEKWWQHSLKTQSKNGGMNLVEVVERPGGELHWRMSDDTRVLQSIAAKRRENNKTPEQRSEEARRREANKSPEAKLARAKRLKEMRKLVDRQKNIEASLKWHASRTPEQKRQVVESREAKRTQEQKNEAARRMREFVTKEQLREMAIARQAAKTPEQRREAIRKGWATRTPEQKAEAVRKMRAGRTSASDQKRVSSLKKWQESRTPEERSATIKKTWATRRAKAALKEANGNHQEKT